METRHLAVSDMKKFLFSTTSLVSVGFIVGTVNSVEAAEKIKLGVSGYAQYFVAYMDQSEIAQSGQSEVDVKNNGEIWFKGSTKLDNGISVGVDIQFEAFQSGDQVDEQYMWVESATMGKLIVGDENGAAYLLHLWAPFAGIDLDTGTIEGFAGFYANNTGGTLFNSPLGTTLGRAIDNDSAKIT